MLSSVQVPLKGQKLVPGLLVANLQGFHIGGSFLIVQEVRIQGELRRLRHVAKKVDVLLYACMPIHVVLRMLHVKNEGMATRLHRRSCVAMVSLALVKLTTSFFFLLSWMPA